MYSATVPAPEIVRILLWMLGLAASGAALYPWMQRAFPRGRGALLCGASAASCLGFQGIVSWALAAAGVPITLACALGWIALAALAVAGWLRERRRLGHLRLLPRRLLLALLLWLGALEFHAVMGDFVCYEVLNPAFIHSIVRAESFPPRDPFFAGSPLSYHYFAQWVYAMPLRPWRAAAVDHWHAIAATNMTILLLVFFGLARLYATRRVALLFTLLMFLGGTAGWVVRVVGARPPIPLDIDSGERAFRTVQLWVDLNVDYPFFGFWHNHFHGNLFAATYSLLALGLLHRRPRGGRGRPVVQGVVGGAFAAVAACASSLETAVAILIGGYSLWLWPRSWRAGLVRVGAYATTFAVLAGAFYARLDLSGTMLILLDRSSTTPMLFVRAFGWLIAVLAIFAVAMLARRRARVATRPVTIAAIAALALAALPPLLTGASLLVVGSLLLWGAAGVLALRRNTGTGTRGAVFALFVSVNLLLALETVTVSVNDGRPPMNRFDVMLKFGHLVFTLMPLSLAWMWRVAVPPAAGDGRSDRGAEAVGAADGDAGRAAAPRGGTPRTAFVAGVVALVVLAAGDPLYLMRERFLEVREQGMSHDVAGFGGYRRDPQKYGYLWVAERLGALYPPDRQPVVVQAARQVYETDAHVPALTGLQVPVAGITQVVQRHQGEVVEVQRRMERVRRLYETDDADEAATIMRDLGASAIVITPIERAMYRVSEAKFRAAPFQPRGTLGAFAVFEIDEGP